VDVFGVADDGCASAVGRDDAALGNSVDRVVGALAVHVRLHELQQRLHRGLAEHDDVVHAAQRRDELGAIHGRG
jgi:hypothetical protein